MLRLAWSIPGGTTLTNMALIANVKALQQYLGIPQTGGVDDATITATNKTLGTNYDASYITQNAVTLAEAVRVVKAKKSSMLPWIIGGGVVLGFLGWLALRKK